MAYISLHAIREALIERKYFSFVAAVSLSKSGWNPHMRRL